jgi:hypothetical protein
VLLDTRDAHGLFCHGVARWVVSVAVPALSVSGALGSCAATPIHNHRAILILKLVLRRFNVQCLQ